MIFERSGLMAMSVYIGEGVWVSVDDGTDKIALTIGKIDTALLTAEQARYLAGRLSSAASRLEKRKPA